jgi:predicted ribosomally synthesized peptide with SipW-like signal peptide
MRIAKSLFVIVAVIALAAGATSAVFTSQAKVEGNTFATGALEIRINGSSSIPGFDFCNAAPGDCEDGQFTVNNYGAPFFGGPSTLPAKTLTIKAIMTGGDVHLWNKLQITVEANRGWPTWMPVYSGPIDQMYIARDLLSPRWTELPAGWSEDVRYNVCLPADANNSYMGESVTFDFVVDAASS